MLSVRNLSATRFSECVCVFSTMSTIFRFCRLLPTPKNAANPPWCAERVKPGRRYQASKGACLRPMPSAQSWPKSSEIRNPWRPRLRKHKRHKWHPLCQTKNIIKSASAQNYQITRIKPEGDLWLLFGVHVSSNCMLQRSFSNCNKCQANTSLLHFMASRFRKDFPIKCYVCSGPDPGLHFLCIWCWFYKKN